MDALNERKGLRNIKMGFYVMEAAHDPDMTFEERVAEVKNIGKNAAADFARKFAGLNQWFTEYDAIYLLSFCKNYFICSEEGRDEEAEQGYLEFPFHYLEILQAFALAQPRSYAGKPLFDDVYRFKETMREIGKLSLWKMFDLPENVSTIEQINAYRIRIEMMSHTTAVRNWAYHHQMTRVTRDLAEKIKVEFKQVHNFCPVAFLELLEALADMVETKLNAHLNKIRAALSRQTHIELMEEYERQFPDVKVADRRQKENIWERSGKNLENVRAISLAHSDLYLDKIFSFNLDEIEIIARDFFTREQLTNLFDKLSYSFGDLKDTNQEHIILSNPVHQKPFIKIGEGEYFTSLWGILTHLSINLLENFVAENENLRTQYNKRKGEYLEDQVHELVEKGFPNAAIYKGCKWELSDDKQYETDSIIVLGSFILIIEAKSGSVTPAARRAAPDRLKKTLEQLIEEPSDQALRLIQYMKDNSSIILDSENKGRITIDTTTLKYFIPLGVTLSHFGVLSTNLKLLIEGELLNKKIYQLAPSISLTDLQLVFDFLPLETSKLHYLQRRRELELYMEYIADEMDLLAFYLDTGFNLGKSEYSKEYKFNLILKSKELDPYIINTAQGLVTQKPESNVTQWWKDILNRLAEQRPPTWLETSYILLNFMKEEQEKLEAALKALVREILAGKMEHKHNWIIGATSNENRKFITIAYPYLSKHRKERNAMMEDIISNNYDDKIKGIVVMAINIEKAHYPYSVLCSLLSPKLFESNFQEMLNINRVKIEDENDPFY